MEIGDCFIETSYDIVCKAAYALKRQSKQNSIVKATRAQLFKTNDAVS